MAKRTLKYKHKSKGALRMNADARHAIEAARAGNCRTALRTLFDAAPHNQGGSRGREQAGDFRTAAIIIEKLCMTNKTKKRGKYRYKTGNAYAYY